MGFNAWLRMAADFENQTGKAHLERELTLDYVNTHALRTLIYKC